MGLHHDGDVDAFWLQLEGRRTVTLGPRVRRGTPEDLDDRLAEAGRPDGWRTFDLDPGTLFHLPPRTPHRVVCRGRSLALSLTWKARAAAVRAGRRSARPRAKTRAAGLTVWDVVSGRADPIPKPSRTRVWTLVPVVAGRLDGGVFPLWTPGGGQLRLPSSARPLASRLVAMPSFHRRPRGRSTAAVALLLDRGILGPHDLPLLIRPDRPAALDGWSFR
jgi:hypothetical protein